MDEDDWKVGSAASASGLTDKAMGVLACIARRLAADGWAPSLREIAALALGHNSTGHARYYVDLLERGGYIERATFKSRAIRLTPRGKLAVAPEPSLKEDA